MSSYDCNITDSKHSHGSYAISQWAPGDVNLLQRSLKLWKV